MSRRMWQRFFVQKLERFKAANREKLPEMFSKVGFIQLLMIFRFWILNVLSKDPYRSCKKLAPG